MRRLQSGKNRKDLADPFFKYVDVYFHNVTAFRIHRIDTNFVTRMADVMSKQKVILDAEGLAIT